MLARSAYVRLKKATRRKNRAINKVASSHKVPRVQMLHVSSRAILVVRVRNKAHNRNARTSHHAKRAHNKDSRRESVAHNKDNHHGRKDLSKAHQRNPEYRVSLAKTSLHVNSSPKPLTQMAHQLSNHAKIHQGPKVLRTGHPATGIAATGTKGTARQVMHLNQVENHPPQNKLMSLQYTIAVF